MFKPWQQVIYVVLVLICLHFLVGWLLAFVLVPWLQAETKVATILGNFGPSGVRALPLAAGINVGGHYKWHFFSFFLLSSGSLLILPEGVVVGF